MSDPGQLPLRAPHAPATDLHGSGAVASPGAALDALAMACLARELAEALAGARVQQVTQLDRLTVALECYRGERRWLILSADPSRVAVRLSAEKARRGGGEATPLTLALRAHVVGARLVLVARPEGERILHLGFDAAEPLSLVCEPIGRLANLVLVRATADAPEGGGILAVARPVTGAMSRARQLLPGRPYAPPPRPARPDAADASEAVLAEALAAAADGAAWRALLAAVAGIGPLAAREAVHRAAGDASARATDVPASALHVALRELTGRAIAGDEAPSIARRRADGAILAWAPYPPEHLASDEVAIEAMPSLLDAIEAAEASRGADAYREARADVARLLSDAGARLSRRRASLARELDGRDDEAIEGLRLAGDLILAFQHQIAPGQTRFAPPLDLDGSAAEIALDPTKTAVENAQAYYARYRRARRAREAVPGRLAEVDAALATLEQWATDLALAEDRPEIEAVRDALARSGWLPGAAPARGRAPRPAAPRGPLRWVSPDGLTVLVGRNSAQNEHVTFALARRGDAWLHARGVPGAHVIVRCGGRPVPEPTLLAAAAVAAWYSSARGEARVEVTVADIRHVRRLEGGGPGMVTVREGRTVVVRPAPLPEAST